MTREEIIAAVQVGKSLARADLRGANLQGANLLEANLQEANLQGASLWEADLYGANLRRASLQRANLQRADLQGADLRRANFQEADLFLMSAYKAKTTGIKLSWVPKKGDLVRVYPDYPRSRSSVLGILLEDPDPDYIFDPVSVRIRDEETKLSITHMKPASRLEEVIQEELKRELKR
jgi:hypothetical protein